MRNYKTLNVGKSVIALAMTCALMACGPNEKKQAAEPTLRAGIGQDFLIGVAVNSDQMNGTDSVGAALIAKQFTSIVPENCMKSALIHPEENRYDWMDADAYVDFGTKHHMFVIGHCLIWHSQLASWFCVDDEGNNVSPEVLKQRMKKHITTIMTRYKGRVNGWDVVNEALLDNGEYRPSKFYEILGAEFIPYAFQCAHEADPDAELYYNDYSMHIPAKQQGVLRIVKSIKDYGATITGIGMQSHCNMKSPSVAEVEEAIKTLSSTGCSLMVTEFDLSAIPFPKDLSGAGVEQAGQYSKIYNPYPTALPDSISQLWEARMKGYFDVYRKHKDVIKRVTVWGLTDGASWRNDWPVAGRTDYPTLFDRTYKAKTFTQTLMK